MTKLIRDEDIEIMPPARNNVPATVVTRTPVPHAPYRPDPGGIVSGIPARWTANSQTRTYEAYKARSIAERNLVEADTALGKSLVENMRMRQEYAELPQTLAADRAMRQLRRSEEIRDLCHQIELAEMRRFEARSAAEVTLVHARRVLLDAEQQLEAQRMYGLHVHSLKWRETISETEQRLADAQMRLREQEAIVAEQRRRDRASPTLDDLYARRAEMHADGEDTTEINIAIERETKRQGKT